MFQKTRIKLTAWYLLIIMLISISFSLVIFRVQIAEVTRFAMAQRVRFERQFPPSGDPFDFRMIDRDLIAETRDRLILNTLLINGVILVFSGCMGYFLAGKTLRPIKDMVDEQDRFISDSSHELRTPLTSLKSAMEVALMDKNLTLKDAKKLISDNIDDVNRLQKLSDSLIQLSRKGTQTSMKKESISTKSLIKTSILQIKPQADKKKITIKALIKNVRFMGHQDKLNNLLVILLDNAVKYSPAKTTIIIKSWKTKKNVYFSVKDHGDGISEKDLPLIFDRFFRSEVSRSNNKTSGYGLGLSIAKMIADEHLGSIIVKSNLGHGTVFTVRLPLQTV